MKNTIYLGVIDISFHKVAAGVFHNILEYWGFDIRVEYAPHEEMFQRQKDNKIDLLISAWIPGSHNIYLQSYLDEVILLHPIYEPFCVWCIPGYAVNTGIKSVEDLQKEEIASEFEKEIHGIGMGAGISRFSVEIIQKYDLDQQGFFFTSNKPEDFYRIIEEDIRSRKNIIIPLWHPQFLHHQNTLISLQDPKNLLRGKDKDAATPVLRKEAARCFSSKQMHILDGIYLGNEAVSAMDCDFHKNSLGAKEAALNWINSKFGSLEKYIAYLENRT